MKLLALTGCRPGEVVNLKWSEVDQAGRCLRLADSKEGMSIRPLGKHALVLLDALKRTGDDLVFPAVRRGKTFGGLKGGWRRLMQHAGLQGVTPHVLRHSFASTADDLEYTLATTAAMLGHSTGTVTARYIHKLDAVLIAAADQVAGAIHTLASDQEWSGSGRTKRVTAIICENRGRRDFLEMQLHGGPIQVRTFSEAASTARLTPVTRTGGPVPNGNAARRKLAD